MKRGGRRLRLSWTKRRRKDYRDPHVAGLIRPNAGEVRLFGQPLLANRYSLMRHVGALVETPSLMMPLLIALETALLNGIEHSNRQWKHIFRAAGPRHAVYVSKVVVAQVLIFISSRFTRGLVRAGPGFRSRSAQALVGRFLRSSPRARLSVNIIRGCCR